MFDLLLKVLMGVIEFLARIKRCLKKYLWVRLLNLVHLGKILVSSNVEDVVMRWRIKMIFTNLYGSWC